MWGISLVSEKEAAYAVTAGVRDTCGIAARDNIALSGVQLHDAGPWHLDYAIAMRCLQGSKMTPERC